MNPFKNSIFVVIATVTTVLVSELIKQLYFSDLIAKSPKRAAIVAYLLGGGLTLVCMISLVEVVGRIWESSVKFRRFCDRWILFKTFLEGWWLDVGLDTSGDQHKILNYSSIHITREGEEYRVSGRSWELLRGDSIGRDWRSEYCEVKHNTLTFWYKGEPDGKATYTFSEGPARTPTGFQGEYGAGNFTTQGKLKASDPGDDRQAAARNNMLLYCRQWHFDPESGLQLPVAQRRQWYSTFLRNSDKLDQESSLLRQLIDGLDHPAFAAVLDIGPGEGGITRGVLQALVGRGLVGAGISYTAVDPVAVSFDSLERDLGKLLQLNNLTFVKGRIEDHPAALAGKTFDLVLLFNVLYYVRSPQDLCDGLAQILAPGGVALSLHTDIQDNAFLSGVIAEANPQFDRNVVQKMSSLGQRPEIEVRAQRKSGVTVKFPREVSGAQWAVIERGNSRFQDDAIADVTDLICFLVDKDVEEQSRSWQTLVRTVRDHLQKNGNKVELPIVAQLLVRKP